VPRMPEMDFINVMACKITKIILIFAPRFKTLV